MKQPKRQKQQEKLDNLIRDLERDLSEGKSQVAVLEEAYKRLDESERLCRELADENRRLVTENSGWRERSAKNEENERLLSTLQQQLETLKSEHERAVERNRELEQELTLGRDPHSSTSQVARSNGTGISRNIAAAFQTYVVQSTQTAGAWIGGNSRVALAFACVVILVIAAALTLGSKEAGPSKRLPAYESEHRTEIEPTPKPTVKPVVNTVRPVRGVFQTVRPAIVYSRPGEESEIVANIEKGTRVNVVNSRNGWLEIHSKHGRPPGFIRQEVAERIASN
jgi:uncharacterized protein YaaW (UPF0174 family)